MFLCKRKSALEFVLGIEDDMSYQEHDLTRLNSSTNDKSLIN